MTALYACSITDDEKMNAISRGLEEGIETANLYQNYQISEINQAIVGKSLKKLSKNILLKQLNVEFGSIRMLCLFAVNIIYLEINAKKVLKD